MVFLAAAQDSLSENIKIIAKIIDYIQSYKF